ncbi:MAG: IclR family transcriptional regulator [Ilumatobacter sp.]|uniref:IclR family transcriptional regulator n=1 Tax=Ilumatobacter sp. TaxID=1967498 RepID=UPI00391AE322
MPESDAASIVQRTSLVLDAFRTGRTSLGLSELSRRTGLPKPTVHRLAGQLVEYGFLERHGTTYRLGVRLFELGLRVPRSRVLREAALPFLEDLYVASAETVHLATRDGDDVMYLEKIRGHRSAATPSEIAGRMPLHSTATGKSILAFSGSDEIEAYLSRPLRRVTPRTTVVASVLREQLDQTREFGWAVEREETLIGFVSVAAPVLIDGETPVASLSVTGPLHRLDPVRFGPTVRTAARALARVLGGGDSSPGGAAVRA